MSQLAPAPSPTPPAAIALRSDPPGRASPLMLCDRLITLAEQADRAGFASTAGRLVDLAYSLFDDAPATA